jgi:hypothetical protein
VIRFMSVDVPVCGDIGRGPKTGDRRRKAGKV